MKIISIDTDTLTKIVLEKVFDELEVEKAIFLTSEDLSLEEQLCLNGPDVIFFTLRKGRHLSVTQLCRFSKKISNDCQIIVISEPHQQRFLEEMAENETFKYLAKPFSKAKILQLLKPTNNFEVVEGNYLADELRRLVLKKNYKIIYQQIQSFQEIISEKYITEETATIDRLNQMVDVALELMNCTNALQKRIYREKFVFNQQVLADKFRIQFLIYQLLREVYRQRSIQKYPQLSRLFSYIDDNLYEDMSLVGAADSCEISQSYLSRLLKDCYSLGFNSYIQIEKVNLAKRAFYYNNDKIIDVSFQLAYSEPSYFCKVFKRIEGQTPTCVKAEMDKIKQTTNV